MAMVLQCWFLHKKWVCLKMEVSYNGRCSFRFPLHTDQNGVLHFQKLRNTMTIQKPGTQKAGQTGVRPSWRYIWAPGGSFLFGFPLKTSVKESS